MDKKAEVVQMNHLGADEGVENPKAPPRGFGLNVWKHTVLIGFCVWTSILAFCFTFKPFRMVPVITPADPLHAGGASLDDPKMSPGSDGAVAALIFTIVVGAVIIVLMFVEPIMMRILGDWVMDVHDGSGIGGIFARGIFRAPEGTPPPPKGKFIFALIVAICAVEIPMGVFAWGPAIHNTLGFALDGNVILKNKMDAENAWVTENRGMWQAPINQALPFAGGMAKDAAAVYGLRKYTAGGPGSKCHGTGDACAAIGVTSAGGPPDLFSAAACVGAYQTGTPLKVCTDANGNKSNVWPCSSLPDPAGPHVGETPCVWEAPRFGGSPHMVLLSMIEYEQAMNTAGFFFLDLLIGMPLIMYITVPLIMGFTSAIGCMYSKCGNCLTPCVGCMDPPMNV